MNFEIQIGRSQREPAPGDRVVPYVLLMLLWRSEVAGLSLGPAKCGRADTKRRTGAAAMAVV
jgi:hypothetical protein